MTEVECEEGRSLLDVAKEYDLDLEGACEASCACSTCHVILEDKLYDDLIQPQEEEEDMLDLAFALTDTSRLACQIKITSLFQGTTVKLPRATRNMFVDKN